MPRFLSGLFGALIGFVGRRKNGDLALAERDNLLGQLRAEIDRRKRAEAALVHAEKIGVVGQLSGAIAHDFKNLLQAISGNLELISMHPDDRQKVERWAANAIAAVRAMAPYFATNDVDEG